MKRFTYLVLVMAGCSLGTGTFAGKTCDTNVDCPAPYACAQVRPGERTCELVRGVETFDPSADNPATYCDVKPILAKSCVSNCHGTDMQYPGSPPGFRLDVYSTGTVLPGAGAKAADIYRRSQDDTMPPGGVVPRTTLAERGLLLRWVNSGAPDCVADAGSSDGGNTDGGSADAGKADAGKTDGG